MIAGYTDTVSIIQHKAYASMMTGNMIGFSRFALAPDGWTLEGDEVMPTAVFILVLILCNMFGVMVFHMAEHLHKYGTSIIAPVGAILIGLMELGSYKGMNIPPRLQLYPLTFIFGIQNAMSLAGAVGVPTTLCTGHLGNLATALQQILACQGSKAYNAKNALSFAIVFCFMAGAILGVFAVGFAKDTAMDYFLLLPATIALAAAMVVDDIIDTERDEAEKAKAASGSYKPLETGAKPVGA